MQRVVFLLWLAVLGFGVPEVFAGSGRMWAVRPDFYLLTIPLYGLHLALLAHLALKSRRSAWPALYLWGVLFGLYETWITKVVWAGYPGSDGFAMGAIAPGFGLHETLGLVLFYHPITSFLLPLALLSLRLPGWAAAFPAPNWLFGPGRPARLSRIGLALIYGAVSGANMAEPGVYLATWLPWLALFLPGWWLIGRLKPVAVRPGLGRGELALASLWLAAIYAVSYGGLFPERLPGLPTQLATLALYALVLFALWRLPARTGGTGAPIAPDAARRALGWIFAVFLLGAVQGQLFVYAPALAQGLAMAAFLAMIPLGVGLLFWLVLPALAGRGRFSAQS